MVPQGLVPVIIGFVILSIGLSLGGTTGYAINPVRDFCPRLVHQLVSFNGKGKSEWGYAWIPFCAPFLASVAGYSFYFLIFLKLIKS
jgi:glycerol uptake facilitator protein